MPCFGDGNHPKKPARARLAEFLSGRIQTELVRSWLSIWRPIIGIRNRSALFLPVEDFAGVIVQTPAGALVDAMHRKRFLLGAGITILACASLILALKPIGYTISNRAIFLAVPFPADSLF